MVSHPSKIYNVVNLHEAGNAAKLLTTMVSKILPSLTIQQEYLRSVTGKITRTLLVKSSSVPSNNQVSVQKKKIKPSHPKANIQVKRKISTPRGNLCLTYLKFKLGMTQVDCRTFKNTEFMCRNVHRTPSKTNKKELQQIMGQVGHHGTATERGLIHLELTKL